MNKQTLAPMWDQIRQKYGVYLRVLDAIPADRFHSHPIEGMRTPAQLVVHVSGSIVRNVAEGVAKGAITPSEAGEDAVAAELTSKDQVIAFARECWSAADSAVSRIGDAELQAMITTPWNMTIPGWVAFSILTDEFIHHRGQLYVFARATGGEPPFMWGFGENEPEFRPAE